MAVFFSAIMPCLAFTYLLRGVDIVTIALLLIYTFFGSLGLSMLGLTLATASKQRYGQIILSVGFVGLLLGAFQIAVLMATSFVQAGYVLIGTEAFWIGHAAVANLYITTFALAYFAAAGMITFATENRSTPLRIVMLIQQASWIGWMGWAWIETKGGSVEAVAAFALVAGVYWFVMGAIMNGEAPEMSRRVKRSLPQTTLGRVFFTWLNPGSGSGLMFTVANLTTIAVIGLVTLFLDGLFWSATVRSSSRRTVFLFHCYRLGLCGRVSRAGSIGRRDAAPVCRRDDDGLRADPCPLVAGRERHSDLDPMDERLDATSRLQFFAAHQSDLVAVSRLE